MVHLTAGLRYTKDEREGLLYTVQNRLTNFAFNFDNSRVDPMVTLAFDATPEVNLYFTYSTGFRAGGANDRSQTFTAFGPEEVESYEIGAKMDMFNRVVRLNLAGYFVGFGRTIRVRVGPAIVTDGLDRRRDAALVTQRLHDGLAALVADWPDDVRAHTVALAFDDEDAYRAGLTRS
jgi:outer membrane receptor protein involved in Fe transport